MLTMLIARKDSNRYARVAARWLQRLLEEHPDATIEEAALAASVLSRFRVPATRRRRRRSRPWPKRRLAGEERTA